MALPRKFKFSDIPAVEAEAKRRAIVMFGEDWKQRCSLTCDARGDAIAAHNLALFFESTKDCRCLWSSDNGIINDVIDRSAARVTFYESGMLESEGRYLNGDPHDAEDRTPAYIEYYISGIRKSEEHYFNGERNDPADGYPAVIVYYPNATVQSVRHFRNNMLIDALDATPAEVSYCISGEVIGGFSSISGKLTAKETIKLIKAAQVARVAALLENSDLSVVPAACCCRKNKFSQNNLKSGSTN